MTPKKTVRPSKAVTPKKTVRPSKAVTPKKTVPPKKAVPPSKTGRRAPVVINDAQSIKALTHPARLVVLDELFAGRELTATECATIAGLSPSAMSYHLRALERAGIVERAESSDGRERPWRSAGRRLAVHSNDSTLAAAAGATLASNVLARISDGLAVWLAGAEQETPGWHDIAGVANARLWLTLDEVTELESYIEEFVDSHRDRTEDDHPAGARHVRTAFVVYPTDAPPPQATKPARRPR